MKHKLLCLAFALLAPVTALAQTTGTLIGKVVDEEGKPVAGAVIRIGGTRQGGVSKVDGSFIIAGIRAADYDINITAISYQPTTRNNVRISIGQTTDLGTIRLSTQAISGGQVVVRADRVIKPEQSGTVRQISREDLERSTRTNLVGAVALQNSVSTAGVNGFSIRGGRSSETSIRVDGVEVSDRFSGGFGGTSASLYPTVSNVAVQEIQVIPSGFSAEYGDVLSGVVNSVTRTGRNDRYEGNFRFRTAVPALYGSSSEITVKKAGTDDDTTLPGYKLQGSGSKLYEFGFGGPIPGTDRVTFFLTGKLNTIDDAGAGYEVYDMSPEYAAQRAAIAREVWGTALEPTNIGKIPGREAMVRNVNAKFKVSLTDEIFMELSGELGLTSRELGAWSTNYMTDHPVFLRYNEDTKEFNLNDTVSQNSNVLERDWQAIDENTIINRYVARYFQQVDDASFFEVLGSYVSNQFQQGRKDETKEYGIFSAYDIYRPIDENGDKVIDRYVSPTQSVLLNQYLDSVRGKSAIQVRNPETGFYEGGESGGASRNPYGIIDLNFPTHGADRSLDFRKSTTINVRGGYETNFKLSDVDAQVKAGFDVSSYTLSRNYNSLPWVANPFFDVYGEEAIYFDTTAAGQKLRAHLLEPYNPLQGALYVQTRFTYKSIVFQPGVRFDFMNPNTKIAPASRNRVVDVANGLDTASDASLKFQVSPRVSVSYPVTDKSQFRVSFAMMFKMPEFNLMYDNAYGSAQRGNQLFGNPDIDPQKVFNYEMGYQAQVAEDYFFDIVAFYRDIYNQSGITYIPAIPSPYMIYSVQEFGNVRGLEVSLRRQLVDNVGAEINYTLQKAVGTSSNPGSNYGTLIGGADPYTGESREVPLTEYPLSYDQTHNLRGTLSLSWGDDEGPAIGGLKLLENTDLTLTATFGTGLPFTRFNTRGQQVGEYNAERYPSVFNTEAHIERGFRLRDLLGESVGNLEVAFYADVFNLLNATPVVAFYTTTGDPNQNGTSLNRQLGDFTATTYYKEIDPSRSETFSSSQYDRFGQRLYNPYADSNLDGVVTQLEKYEGYQRFVATIQSLRGNYAAPLTVSVGVKVRF